MTFRKFDTATWTDPWFEELSPRAKLAFVYLWTNEICNPAGIYELSNKRIKFELGYGIDTVYSELDTKIFWDEGKSTVWVRNFFKRQCQNFKFAISALNSIKDDRYKLSLFIEYNQELLASFKNKDGDQIINLDQYSSDTIPIPYPTEKRREEQSREEQKQSREETDKEITPPNPPKGDEKKPKAWKTDFEIYLTQCRQSYKSLLADQEWIERQEKLNPGVDIKLTMEKAATNYWATEVGWKKKKGKKSKEINWTSTWQNAISTQMNKVYKDAVKKAESQQDGRTYKKL